MTNLNETAATLAADAQRAYTTFDARAALRCALADAAGLCDLMKTNIEAANPGRRKDSVSAVGVELADVAQRLGDLIWALRERIEVPHRDTGTP